MPTFGKNMHFRFNWPTDSVSSRDGRHAFIYLILLSFGFFCYADFAFAQIMYDPIGWIDPFIYVAYGLRYDYANFMDSYYKISRLPWIFTEFVFRQSFWPAPASFLIQVFCFSIMSTSVYAGIRVLFERKAAWFAAIVSIFLPFYHANGGADYHNTLAGPLYFLTFALMMKSLQRSGIWLAFWCGISAAATVHTNPLFVWAIPSVLLPALAYRTLRNITSSALLQLTAMCVAGIITVTILLGLINYAVGRQFLFFMPQINFILHVGSKNEWWSPTTWELLRQSKQTGFLAAVLAISIFELAGIASKSRLKEEMNHVAVHVGYCVTFLLAVLLEAKGQTVLRPEYMGYQYVAATLLPLAAVVSRVNSAGSSRFEMAIGLFLTPVFCTLLLSIGWKVQAYLGSALLPPFVFAIMITLAFYAVSLGSRWLKSLVVPLLIWPVVNVALANPSKYTYDRCNTTPHLNQLITTITVMSDRLTNHPNEIFLWFDRDDKFSRNNSCFGKISFLNFAVSSSESIGEAVGGIFPVIAFDAVTKAQLAGVAAPADIVIVMYVDDSIPRRFIQIAAKLGFNSEMRMRYFDRISGIKFDFLSITPAPAIK